MFQGTELLRLIFLTIPIRSDAHLEAALAADLIRSSTVQSSRGCAGSWLDQESEIRIVPEGCASSQLDQELENLQSSGGRAGS